MSSSCNSPTLSLSVSCLFTPQSSSEVYTDFKKMCRKAEKTRHFLESISVDSCSNLATYDHVNEVVTSRSSFKTPLIRKGMNIFTWNATFEHLRSKGLEGFDKKINKILTTINLNTSLSSNQNSYIPLLITLIGIKCLLSPTGSTTQGIIALCEKYRQEGKPKNASYIQGWGDHITVAANTAYESLLNSLSPLNADVKDVIVLETFDLRAKQLFYYWRSLIADLDNVAWTPNQGISTSVDHVTHIVNELKVIKKLTDELGKIKVKEEIQTAAKKLGFYYNSVNSYTTPYGEENGEWTAYRPREKALLTDGVIASCERKKSSKNPDKTEKTKSICNLYLYSSDPGTSFISSGAFDSPQKADEFVALWELVKEQGKINEKSRTFIISLNSHLGEAGLLGRTKEAVSKIQTTLQEKYPLASVGQFNLGYNIASGVTPDPGEFSWSLKNLMFGISFLTGEERKSLFQTNLSALRQFAGYVAQDITALLCDPDLANPIKELMEKAVTKKNQNVQKEEPALENAVVTDPSSNSHSEDFQDFIKDLVVIDISPNLPLEDFRDFLKDLKQICATNENQQIFQSCIDQLNHAFPISREKDEQTDQTNLSSNLNSEKVNNLIESDITQNQNAEHLFQFFQKVYTSCDSAYRELFRLSNLNSPLAASKIQKARILIELFLFQLGRQLNKSHLTRTTQIELLLLSSKMHEVFLAIICKSGLDRSAAIRSLYLALLFMKNKFFEEHESVKKATKNANFINETNSYSDLFELINSIDATKKELFDLWETYVKKQNLESFLCSDLETFDSAKIYTENLKEGFQNAIRQNFTNKGPEADAKIRALLDTLDYLEIFFTNLMKEQRKTFFSTGVLGFKYKQFNVSNPHTLERIPPFILVKTEKGSIPVRLLTPDGQFTKAAEQLIIRNGTYRGS